MDNMNNLRPALSDRDLFAGAVHTSVPNIFIIIDPSKSKVKQEEESCSLFAAPRDPCTPVPPKETVIAVSYYFDHEGLYQAT